MNKSIYSFVFRCSGCGKISSIEEKYDENKEYTCPLCKITAIIPRKCLKYEAKKHPYRLICPHCSSFIKTYDADYKGEIDGYYVTEFDCPECMKHAVIKEETTTRYFIRKGRL